MNVDNLEIRPATFEDALAVQVLRKHAWQARYVSPDTGVTKEILTTSLAKLPPSEDDLEHYRQMLDKPDNIGKNLVALLNGRIIGTVTYDTLEDDTGDIGVFVADDYNGKGVGDRLLDVLVSRSDNPLQVEIYARNPSRDFYKAHGFVEVGEESNHHFTEEAYLPVQTLRLDPR